MVPSDLWARGIMGDLEGCGPGGRLRFPAWALQKASRVALGCKG